jgi:hypothetical protein
MVGYRSFFESSGNFFDCKGGGFGFYNVVDIDN